MFQQKGVIDAENSTLASKSAEEQLELATEHAIESNAEEVTALEDNIFQFFCSPENFGQTQTLLEKLGYTILNASVDYLPLKMQELGENNLQLYERLMKKLDETPEVVRLFDNVRSS